jgi:PAS domain S-box-containing protein
MDQKKQLEDSEEKYRLVVNSIHEVIFQLNDQGLVEYANQYWKELFGSDVPTEPFSLKDHIHPDDQMIYEELLQLITTGKENKQECELRFKTYNHAVIWLQITIVPLVDKNGVVLGAHGRFRIFLLK